MRAPLILALLALLALPLAARPLQAQSDAQVLQRLDGGARNPAQRAWRQALARDPLDAPSALALGQSLLEQARRQGDARLAGRALAVLEPFGAQPPAAIAVLRATLLQHLHQFDAAAALLERSLAQAQAPGLPQAWLLLASVRRTQGQLKASDSACEGLSRTGATLHAQACRLENAGLRDPAATPAWQALLARPGLDAATQAWLRVSWAEQLWRAGDAAAAEHQLRLALAIDDQAYTRCLLADLLDDANRADAALALLQALPASDAVLVRLAALGRKTGHPKSALWRAEMQTRIAQVRERQRAAPQEEPAHLREQALFALEVQQRPREALQLARANLRQQREAADLWLAWRAAQAAQDPAALRDLRQLADRLEIRDARRPA